MKHRITFTIIFFLIVSLASGHEFWLQTEKFRFSIGEEMKVDFMVGENFTGEFWDLTKHKVEKLDLYSSILPVKSLLKDIKPTKGKNVSYKFENEGTHLFVLESNSAFIEMEAGKFNEYLKEDGMENILDLKKKSNELNKRSKEYYKRFAKLIVQSGSKTDETFRKRIGLRYEIIPLTNPALLKVGDYLECRLFWDNIPAPHTMVKVWNHVGNKTFLQNIYSEDDGTIKFPISSVGPWMVSAVKMIPSEKQGADYQSLWASLVFGVELTN